MYIIFTVLRCNTCGRVEEKRRCAGDGGRGGQEEGKIGAFLSTHKIIIFKFFVYYEFVFVYRAEGKYRAADLPVRARNRK